MNFSFIKHPIELFPEENRLMRQAKSGDTNAFVQLYDAYVECVYRYIHFLAPNDRIAEGLTFQVFFKAWERLDHYRIFGSSFVEWLYSIAQNQLISYYRTHKKIAPPDNDFILAARGGDFKKEFQAIRDGLQFLTAEQQQVLILKFIVGMPNKNIARVLTRGEGDICVLQMHALQALAEYFEETELKINKKGFQQILEECLMRLAKGVSTVEECLVHYPEYAAQLSPLLETVLLLNIGRDVKPLPTFNAYTRDALIQYVRNHPRQPKIVMPVFQRAALTFAMLVAVLLVSGTALAQSALPGDTFYTWKRSSEQVWRAVSFNPVATDIILAQRRLDEWVAVANDPTRSASAMTSAMNGYLEILAKLKSTEDVETLTLIVPALQSQQQTMNDAGLSSSELDDYLIQVVDIISVDVVTPTEIVPTVAIVPTEIVPTVVPTEIVSTAVPTEIVPTIVPTEIPTEILPTIVPTEIPTEIVPTIVPTEIATEIVPTVIPTEIVPTVIPTEVVPTEIAPTAIPTEIVPTFEPPPG